MPNPNVQNRMEKEKAIRQQASVIVSGQPIIAGMRIMDKASEEFFSTVRSHYTDNPSREVKGLYTAFPDIASMPLELEKLKMYGMITDTKIWMGDTWRMTLTPQGVTYFQDKERALEQEKAQKEKHLNIGTLIVNGSNLILGNVQNSTLSIDNSITRIEQEIEEKGGEEKEELRELLEEVKELIENIQASHHIPKNRGLFAKLSSHLEKHGWFYGEIVGFLGNALLQMLCK